jgi:hypothetical protein
MRGMHFYKNSVEYYYSIFRVLFKNAYHAPHQNKLIFQSELGRISILFDDSVFLFKGMFLEKNCISK